MMGDEMDREMGQGRSLVLAGKHVEFWRADSGWEYVHRSDARRGVTIVAVTDEKRIVLIEQHRVPLGRNAIELPAGLVEGTGDEKPEAVADAVKRELQEETGYTCERVEIVATGSSSPGITDELNSLCLAHELRWAGEAVEWVDMGDGVRKQARPRGLQEEGERITVYEAPVETARAWLERRSREGIVVDLKVYAGLYFASTIRQS
jgi:ADP-ribose pyrophosphatase